MYSGTTLRTKSGNVIGAHQKIDRVARKHLTQIMPTGAHFPHARDILRFEGRDGPDGIKRKSPARDEPWHYIDPDNHDDMQLITAIEDHTYNLTEALVSDNHVRASFEAAWLAHAIVDGLTPAHHYPLEEKLTELRGGEGLESRTTYRKKLVMPGGNRRDQVRNNWEFWGAKGVMTTHVLFEIGIATTIAPLKLQAAKPSGNDLVRVEQIGAGKLFRETMYRIHHLKMYETFHRQGWTRTLARLTRNELGPEITKMVTLAWYYAAYKADKRKRSRL